MGTVTRSRRAPLLSTALATSLILLAACSSSPEPTPAPPTALATSDAASTAVTIVTVGDISCDPDDEVTPTRCQQKATAETAASLDPDRVIALGDLQYESGAREDFLDGWSRSWGRFKQIIVPVPGNHEYYTEGAGDYLDYFGTANHYVLEIGSWRAYLLDSNCSVVSCDDQAAWLAQDAADHPGTCAIAAMHHPRFSSGGQHGSQPEVQPLWEAAVLNGVDVVLAGHDHHYERFALMDAGAEPVADDAGADAPDAARSFVVGTGGKSLYDMDEPVEGSEYTQNDDFGVLELTLSEGSYAWRFVTTGGQVLDEGEEACR